jgi:hypothetical protein
VRARYEAAMRLEDALDVADTDPSTATMLLARVVSRMLEM